MRVVDGGILEQGSEDEHETRDQVDIDGLYVADARQRRSHARTNRRHSEHGRDSQGHASRRRLVVDPKRHPREHDDENRWQVRLKDEVTDVTLEQKAQR